VDFHSFLLSQMSFCS